MVSLAMADHLQRGAEPRPADLGLGTGQEVLEQLPNDRWGQVPAAQAGDVVPQERVVGGRVEAARDLRGGGAHGPEGERTVHDPQPVDAGRQGPELLDGERAEPAELRETDLPSLGPELIDDGPGGGGGGAHGDEDRVRALRPVRRETS